MIEIPKKIYIDKSPVHGWGVFAKETILEGEVIEECPILTLPIYDGESSPILIDYRFNFPSGSEGWTEQVIPFGYGGLYNHSDTPNANWYSNNDKRTFLFFATKNIEIGEEIFTYYGNESYWNDGRSNINVI
jgi:SET domain-containing protein